LKTSTARLRLFFRALTIESSRVRDISFPSCPDKGGMRIASIATAVSALFAMGKSSFGLLQNPAI
jgi:hypothetical protein